MTTITESPPAARTASVQPTAAIADITVHPHYRRRDLGKLRDLQLSIRRDGLLRPVPVTADGALIAGERRLRACQNLGWDRIPVIIATSDSHAIELLAAEQADKGSCIKARSASELALLGLHVEAFRRVETEMRRAAGRQHRAAPAGQRKSQVVAAEIAGMPDHYYSQIKPIAMASVGFEAHRSGHGHTPVDSEWSARSRQALDLIDRVYAGERVEQVSLTGYRRRLTINSIYREWLSERTRRRDAANGTGNDSEPNVSVPATPAGQRAQREALAKGLATLTGLCHGLASITDIDPAVTREEAAAYNRDLSNASRVLGSLRQKIKEYANGIA